MPKKLSRQTKEMVAFKKRTRNKKNKRSLVNSKPGGHCWVLKRKKQRPTFPGRPRRALMLMYTHIRLTKITLLSSFTRI